MKLCVNEGNSDQETVFLVCHSWGRAFPTSGAWVDEKCDRLLPLGRNCRPRMRPVGRKGAGLQLKCQRLTIPPRFSIFLNKCFCLLYALMTISRDFKK